MFEEINKEFKLWIENLNSINEWRDLDALLNNINMYELNKIVEKNEYLLKIFNIDKIKILWLWQDVDYNILNEKIIMVIDL